MKKVLRIDGIYKKTEETKLPNQYIEINGNTGYKKRVAFAAVDFGYTKPEMLKRFFSKGPWI